MNNKDFNNLLIKNNFLSDIYKHVLSSLGTKIKNANEDENILNTISIIFSLICDGNVCVSLKTKILENKWNEKINQKVILSEDDASYSKEELELIKVESLLAITNISNLNEINYPSLFVESPIFKISEDNNFIYVNKYFYAEKSLEKYIKELFINQIKQNNKFDIDKYINGKKLQLAKEQKDIIDKGLNSNLFITGGPGTGKTTSIFFLLFSLLNNKEYQDYNIYLTAPSGKAADNMRSSISGNIKFIKSITDEQQKIIDRICSVDGKTIHNLLGQDYGGAFKRNEHNKFDPKSIFVIDEASMIDIFLFSSLLSAIDSNSRVFILGDKNQLPSVECGSVFGSLINLDELKDNLITLKESQRFKKGTEIYELSALINENKNLDKYKDCWRESIDFKIEETNSDLCPIYFYKDNNEILKTKEIFENYSKVWAEKYYKDLMNKYSDLGINDENKISHIDNQLKESKILCSQNKGYSGTIEINNYIKANYFKNDKVVKYFNHTPGEIIMITKNNDNLSLKNGENGLLVSFKNDDCLYFATKKNPDTLLRCHNGYKNDEIFTLFEYVFYPLRLIPSDEYDYSFAMTIHKSQGSDYNNILVILPTRLGHPLLNRQIIYTGITRTKGNTYIIGRQATLVAAKETLLSRDMNIRFDN